MRRARRTTWRTKGPSPRLGAAVAIIAIAWSLGCGEEAPPARESNGERPADTAMRYVGPSLTGKEQAAAAIPARITPAANPAPKPTEPLPPGSSCITSECHASFGAAHRVHGPIAVGDCATCHGDDLGDHTFPLRREGDRTCTFCHQIGNARIHRHPALGGADFLAMQAERTGPAVPPGCMACHEPHASGTKFLLVADTVAEVCASCHPPDERRHAHGPYEAKECSACHMPHDSNHRALLRGGDGPEHCYMCHEETRYVLTNAPFVHQPAVEDCTTCHEHHAPDHRDHLVKPVERLCFSCHADLEKSVAGSPTPHAAVFTADSCANCHDSHAAGRPNLLRDRQTTLCLSCHGQPVRAFDGRMIPDMTASVTGRRFLHGPVESGDCSACHSVHGASHTHLLKETFPPTFYAGFDLGNYALCFSCHPKELVLAARTTTLTDFRDGEVNLHYLHVHRDSKGRTCRTCHEIHGSDLPAHMASEVPFEGSQWLMPIGFTRTDDGGRCAPGCHAAMSYSRTGDTR